MIQILSQNPVLAITVAGIFGLLVGSFLNVVIHRLPRMMELQWQAEAAAERGEELPEQPAFNLVVPRSRCPHCGHMIRAWENVPIISWLVLRGRCSSCSKPISARYPLVEAVTGALCALAIFQHGATAAGLGAVLMIFFLVTLALIDFDTQLLPDTLTLGLLWLGLLFNQWGVFAPLPSAVAGAMLGYGVLWSIYWLFKLVTGKEGMGYGDFKLLAALGAWFGWQAIPSIVLLSSVVGTVVGVALIAFARHRREVPIPFGPYLAGAGLLMLFLREPMRALIPIG